MRGPDLNLELGGLAHARNEGGADGGTRTRIPFREADFRTTSAFAAATLAFVVWTIPSP